MKVTKEKNGSFNPKQCKQCGSPNTTIDKVTKRLFCKDCKKFS